MLYTMLVDFGLWIGEKRFELLLNWFEKNKRHCFTRKEKKTKSKKRKKTMITKTCIREKQKNLSNSHHKEHSLMQFFLHLVSLMTWLVLWTSYIVKFFLIPSWNDSVYLIVFLFNLYFIFILYSHFRVIH